MVYTQVEMTPQTTENHMKKQGNNSPPKKPRTMYTLDYTQVYTSEARDVRKAHPLRVTRDRLYVGEGSKDLVI